MRVEYELNEGQKSHFHEMPFGLKREVITYHKKGESESEKGSLVFVHGSFHGGWRWSEHWLPFFSNQGFRCFSISLLAQVLAFFHSILLVSVV